GAPHRDQEGARGRRRRRVEKVLSERGPDSGHRTIKNQTHTIPSTATQIAKNVRGSISVRLEGFTRSIHDIERRRENRSACASNGRSRFSSSVAPDRSVTGTLHSPSTGGSLCSSRRAASLQRFWASFVRWSRTAQTVEISMPSTARNVTTTTSSDGWFIRSAS